MKVRRAKVAMKGVVEKAALTPNRVDPGEQLSQSTSARGGSILGRLSGRKDTVTAGMHVLASKVQERRATTAHVKLKLDVETQ